MNTFRRTAWAAAVAASAGLFSAGANAQDKSLTLCWAAWDPANALVELSKDFTAKTGIQMKFEFVPWPNFAARMLNELNSKGKLCDLLIGDSQWIGSAATEGHYVKLNEFFDKNGIKMSDFMPATVTGYSEWPKNTPNYWALPAMGDAVAFTYRKDWFARADLQKEFKAKYKRDLAAPTTWAEFKDVGEFFQGRTIDGKKVYGAALYTERGSEGITMGVTNTLYAWGFEYDNPKKPYDLNGFVNSKDAAAGLQYYKDLVKCCTPPGSTNAYMSENLDAYKSGQVAMQMNFIAFFPGISKDPQVGGEKTGFLPDPGREEAFRATGRSGHLRGQVLGQASDGARVHEVVRATGDPKEVVGHGRLHLPELHPECSGLRQEHAVREGVPRLHEDRQGLLGRADLRATAAVDAKARA
jgi:multiple sugar transport system substrate-binding protein